MRYARDVPRVSPPEVMLKTVQHIQAHLSSIATEDDNPTARAGDVLVEYAVVGDVLRITGSLDAEPVAPYLRDDWTPEQDVAANPLSVPSFEEQR